VCGLRGDARGPPHAPLPSAASRETVKRSELAGHAGYGYCRSHSRFFWGFRLYLLTTAEGMPLSWCLAHSKLGEREVMTALLEREHHLVRSGQVIFADKGFAGREFEAFLTERLGVHLVRPDRRDEPIRHGRLARVRQWIEAVFDTLKGQLSLEQHGGRTRAGVFARTGQRLGHVVRRDQRLQFLLPLPAEVAEYGSSLLLLPAVSRDQAAARVCRRPGSSSSRRLLNRVG
jgi:hypothetical protein